MKALIVWRILAHEKGRSGLAIGGILIAILLMFLQLGFYTAVPRGGLLFYDAMRFDLLLTSSAYVWQAQSPTFPRRRLFQALALPSTAPVAVQSSASQPAFTVILTLLVIAFCQMSAT